MPTERYARTAIALHWIIAVLIIIMLALGFYNHGQAEALRAGEVALGDVTRLYNWHKSIGLTILALSLVRLLWRLGHRPPALPDHMARWEKFAARTTHVAFYVLIIGLPVLGWLTISASARPSFFFNNPNWQIPEIYENSRDARKLFAGLHGLGVRLIIGVLVLHIAAALKHHFLNRDDVFTRMLPERRKEKA